MDIKTEACDEEVDENKNPPNRAWFEVPLLKSDQSTKEIHTNQENTDDNIQDCESHMDISNIKTEDESRLDCVKEEISDERTDPITYEVPITEENGHCSPIDYRMEKNVAELTETMASDVKMNLLLCQLYPSIINLNKPDEKQFNCYDCSYKCRRMSQLKRHKKIHSGEKPFKCDECDYACIEISNLKKHKMVHNGIKPFACDQCDYKCAYSNSLKTHKKIHSDEKPFHCDMCDFKSAISTNLKRHKTTHGGEKPYRCNICDYKCTISTSLKRHMMLHTGEKPFRCDACGYKCREAHRLTVHKKLVHRELNLVVTEVSSTRNTIQMNNS